METVLHPLQEYQAWRDRLSYLRIAVVQHDISPEVREELESEIAQIQAIVAKFERDA